MPATEPRRSNAKLDIRLVTGTFPHESFVYRPAVALARRGHAVTVLARQSGDWNRFPEPLPSNLKVELLPPDISLRDPRRAMSMATRTLRAAMRAGTSAMTVYQRCHADPRTRDEPLRNFVRHLPFCSPRPDVIHFEFLLGGAMYPLVGELAGVPTVVSCRGSDIHWFDLRDTRIQTSMLDCLRNAAAVHCVSSEIAALVQRLVGPRPGVWLNRPAVDTAQISPRTWAARAPDRLQILAVGVLSWHKAFDYLLAALARLRHRGIAFEATILGEGELLAPLRFSVTDLGLDGMVHLPGAVSPDRVLGYLQDADVFVSPSHNEGVSNAVLEAMASGVPVVSTRVGGMPEAIDDGVEGFLVPPRDIDAMAAAIERFARDRQLCATMGRAARARAVAEFSLDRQVETFERIYESVRRGRS